MIRNKIEEIKNNNEINYYDLTGDLLSKYYDLREETITEKFI